MNRICIIDIAGLSPSLLNRERGLWVQSLPSGVRPLEPTFPAIRASVQASLTTGVAPGLHGIVSGALYRRQAHQLSLAERSNTLLTKKRFWHDRHLPSQARCAMLFWCNPLAGGADLVLGAMTYDNPGADVADQPRGLYRDMIAKLGPSQLSLLYGPEANWFGSEWVAQGAARLWADQRVDLMWVYLAGVEFELQRHGPADPRTLAALREVDRMAAQLASAVIAAGGQVVALSDGGYVEVTRRGFPNVLLRRAGLLQTCQTDQGESVDYETSRAFAVVDHQVAHVYCQDDAAVESARCALAAADAIDKVATRDDLFCPGLGHDRAGELVLQAARDAWLDYRWWEEGHTPEKLSPRTCGYDPCQLLDDLRTGPAAIRCSRGLTATSIDDQGILAATFDLPNQRFKATDLKDLLLTRMFSREMAEMWARVI